MKKLRLLGKYREAYGDKSIKKGLTPKSSAFEEAGLVTLGWLCS